MSYTNGGRLFHHSPVGKLVVTEINFATKPFVWLLKTIFAAPNIVRPFPSRLVDPSVCYRPQLDQLYLNQGTIFKKFIP